MDRGRVVLQHRKRLRFSLGSAYPVRIGASTLPDVTAAAGPVGPGSTTGYLIRIGHSLLALITAFVGGQLSRNLHDRNRESTRAMVNPETGHEPTETLS